MSFTHTDFLVTNPIFAGGKIEIHHSRLYLTFTRKKKLKQLHPN